MNGRGAASAACWGGQYNLVRDDGRTVRVLPQRYQSYLQRVCAGSTQTQQVAARRAHKSEVAGGQVCTLMKCKCVERHESAMNQRSESM